MTGGEYLLRQIIEKKNLISSLRDELSELESDLSGMQVEYKNQYAVIESIDVLDGEVTLYVEDKEENSWNEMISVYELLSLFN